MTNVPAEAVHRQEALPCLRVADTFQPPAEFAPCESQLIDQWVSHGEAPWHKWAEMNNAPPEVISGGAFRLLASRYDSAGRNYHYSTWMRTLATMNERSSTQTEESPRSKRDECLLLVERECLNLGTIKGNPG